MGRPGLTILLCILGLCSSAVLSLSLLLNFYCFSNFHHFSNFHSFLNFCFHRFPNFHSHCFLNLSLFVKISLLLTFHFHCLSKYSPSFGQPFISTVFPKIRFQAISTKWQHPGRCSKLQSVFEKGWIQEPVQRRMLWNRYIQRRFAYFHCKLCSSNSRI